MSATWLPALVTLAAAVVGVLGWAARRGWRLMRAMTRFLDDYFGEPEHNGLSARPGVMARLGSVEKLVAQVAIELGNVAAETKPNGGSSMRDAVARTEHAVSEVRTEQAANRTLMEGLRARMEQLENQRAGRDADAGGKKP